MKKYLVVLRSIVLCALFFSFTAANPIEPISIHAFTTDVLPNERDIDTEKINHLYERKLEAAITAYFNKAINKKQIIGAAIGVVKCDSIIYLGGFGKRKSSFSAEVDEETVFRIGSVSKGFAGILAGIHVEEGLLDWNSKIVEYIPNFQLSTNEITHEVTLSHVLSHTAGLPYHSYTNLVENGVALEEIASRFKQVKSISIPGEVYSYQNAAFALSGRMIERVTGKKFSAIIKEKIFDPLEMHSASTDYKTLVNTSNIAYPHRKRYGRWKSVKINKKYYNNAIAAGGVNASITDMAKWMRFLLGNNQDVMSPMIMTEIFSPKIEVEGKSKYYQKWKKHESSYYGFGWRIHNFSDPIRGVSDKMIHHGGHVNSYRSEIAIFPTEDLGITVLFNSPTKLAQKVIPEIHAIVKEVMGIPKEEILAESEALIL